LLSALIIVSYVLPIAALAGAAIDMG